MPILASTVTTIVVFFPVVFLVGAAKLLFVPLPSTISLALVASFWISRTVTPLLCARLLPEHGEHAHGRWAQAAASFFDRIDDFYQQALAWALGHRGPVIGGTLAVFTLSLLLVPLIGSEFFPMTDESQFRLAVRAPVGTRVEETERLIARIEDALSANVPERYRRTMLSGVGLPSTSASMFSSNTGPHSAYIQVDLVSPDQRDQSTEQIVAELRPKN